jgi:hypothetical protein
MLEPCHSKTAALSTARKTRTEDGVTLDKGASALVAADNAQHRKKDGILQHGERADSGDQQTE